MKNIPIGQILLESGYITQQQLDTALQKKSEWEVPIKLGDMLLNLGYVSEAQLVHALSVRLKIPFVDLTTAKIDIEAVRKIPEPVAKRNIVIAFKITNGKLCVATNDPVNFYIFEELKITTGMDIYPMLATKSSIIDAIDKAYAKNTVIDVVNDLNKEHDNTAAVIAAAEEESDSESRVDNAPVVKLVNTIVETAFRLEASDIHVEPFAESTRIRMRVDGELVEQLTVKQTVHASLVTRLKILSGMNIAEHRIPLDGRFGTVIDGTVLDVRVSSIPTVYGEKVVIRLLSTADEKARKITDLGMSQYNYEMFSQLIKCPHGIMLVTGPTGSGKSTTLYAALGELSRPNVNIVTVEDPVEKKMYGINQCQINAKAGLTFSAALRSILRQDPDIIMIGEIRDAETADIAVRAAITGHLVLSTLHTNDAASTILRLVDMGIAPYMIATSLLGVVAQRLVKLLCPKCKEKYLCEDAAELRLLAQRAPVEIYRASANGCDECHNTGYHGRTAIHEIIINNNDIKQIITHNGTSADIQAQAIKNGSRLLRHNVMGMVLQGKTDIPELSRATYTI